MFGFREKLQKLETDVKTLNECETQLNNLETSLNSRQQALIVLVQFLKELVNLENTSPPHPLV